MKFEMAVKFQKIVPIRVVFGMDSSVAFNIPLVIGDKAPTLRFLIQDINGNALGLSAQTSVNFYFRRFNDLEGAINTGHVACNIVDNIGGIAEYTFQDGDLAKGGTYFGDLEMVSGADYKETAPMACRFTVRENNR